MPNFETGGEFIEWLLDWFWSLFAAFGPIVVWGVVFVVTLCVSLFVFAALKRRFVGR